MTTQLMPDTQQGPQKPALAPFYGTQESSVASNFLPEFLRLPRAGSRDPHFGLSRSMWNQLILKCEANGFRPPIKSFSLRRKGTLKGVRIISAHSALDYFRKLEAEQNPPASLPDEDAQGNTTFDAKRIEPEMKPSPPGFAQQNATQHHQHVD